MPGLKRHAVKVVIISFGSESGSSPPYPGASAMAKKKPKRTWVWAPKKPAPPAVPDDLKAGVEARAAALIRDFLEPTFVKPPPKDNRWNYLTGITTKWHRS